MDSDLKLQKKLLSPPGDTIQETLDTISMSQSELAERIGWPEEKLKNLINGREPIAMETATLLEHELGISINFWMTRESEYRSDLSALSKKHRHVRQILSKGVQKYLPKTSGSFRG